MDKIKIKGNGPLKGKIEISGAKNAALPLMAASLLTADKLTLTNVPDLADINSMRDILARHGVKIDLGQGATATSPKILNMQCPEITDITAPYDLVRKMRASILVLGPLLARCGKARVSLPGGCALGTRPVDLHIAGFKKMGAHIELEEGYIVASAADGLRGADIDFSVVTVTGTENLLMAACLAQGQTILRNAAKEPEVTDLAECLVKMGAKIDGIGTATLIIEGVEKLNGAEHAIVADRIVAGTYAVAAVITGGAIELVGARAEHLTSFIEFLEKTGATITKIDNGIRVERKGDKIKPVDITTDPYPAFATDLQAQAMALMCVADGTSIINETIFENRFMHVPELCRMGADISVDGMIATVKGIPKLHGAPVMATDLRASVCLVLAGLAAEGDTVISRVYHLDRGYEHVEEKLAACGAFIERIKEAA